MRIDKKQGFTLPEVLLTAAILAYALSAILASFMNSVLLNESSRHVTIATSHAQFVMEDVRNTAFGSIPTNISTGYWNWNTATIGTNGLTAMNSESISVTSSGTTLLDVTVTVSWKDTKGRSRSKALRTLISS